MQVLAVETKSCAGGKLRGSDAALRVRSGYGHRQTQRERYSCRLASDTYWMEIRGRLSDGISDQPPMEDGWQSRPEIR